MLFVCMRGPTTSSARPAHFNLPTSVRTSSTPYLTWLQHAETTTPAQPYIGCVQLPSVRVRASCSCWHLPDLQPEQSRPKEALQPLLHRTRHVLIDTASRNTID